MWIPSCFKYAGIKCYVNIKKVELDLKVRKLSLCRWQEDSAKMDDNVVNVFLTKGPKYTLKQNIF